MSGPQRRFTAVQGTSPMEGKPDGRRTRPEPLLLAPSASSRRCSNMAAVGGTDARWTRPIPPLVWAFHCQAVSERRSLFLAFFYRFLCSIWNPVSSPRPAVLQEPTRAGAVKVGRRTNLSTPSARCQAIHLDSSEHGGITRCGRDDDQRRARFRSRESIAPHPCMRWIQGIRTMMQIYASAARLRSSGAESFDRHESHAMVRATTTSDRAWRIVA